MIITSTVYVAPDKELRTVKAFFAPLPIMPMAIAWTVKVGDVVDQGDVLGQWVYPVAMVGVDLDVVAALGCHGRIARLNPDVDYNALRTTSYDLVALA